MMDPPDDSARRRGLEYDRRTPLSRLRYGDVQIRTWQVVLAVGAMVALLAVIGIMLMHLDHQHSGTMTTPDGVTHHCDLIERNDDGTIACTQGGTTIVGSPGVKYSIHGS
jgi:hypothetical protein